jgi:hypothetical protein
VLAEIAQAGSAFWLSSAEAPTSPVASATSYGCPENIFGLAIVEAERELIQVERQILFADVVIGADDSTLQERPERFDILSVHVAAHVLASAVRDHFVRHFLLDVSITGVLIRRDQINFIAHRFADESSQGFSVRVLDHLADHVALARDRADHGKLASRASAGLLFVPMAIAVLSADVSFVDFDDAHKLAELRIGKSGAQPMAHKPRGAVRTCSHHPMNLQGADPFLAGQHQVQNLKPNQQPIVRVLENRVDGDREPIRRAGILATLRALPMEGTRLACVHLVIAASRTDDDFGPALIAQIRLASIFIRKHPVEASHRQLSGEFRFVFCLIVLAHTRNIAIPVSLVKRCIIAFPSGKGNRKG